MFSFFKLLIGIFATVVLLTWLATYIDHYKACEDRGGHYNLTAKPNFECQGADK